MFGQDVCFTCCQTLAKYGWPPVWRIQHIKTYLFGGGEAGRMSNSLLSGAILKAERRRPGIAHTRNCFVASKKREGTFLFLRFACIETQLPQRTTRSGIHWLQLAAEQCQHYFCTTVRKACGLPPKKMLPFQIDTLPYLRFALFKTTKWLLTYFTRLSLLDTWLLNWKIQSCSCWVVNLVFIYFCSKDYYLISENKKAAVGSNSNQGLSLFFYLGSKCSRN